MDQGTHVRQAADCRHSLSAHLEAHNSQFQVQAPKWVQVVQCEMFLLSGGLALLFSAVTYAFDASNVTWHVVWVGGQSNSVGVLFCAAPLPLHIHFTFYPHSCAGTNTDAPGTYPVWPINPLIQMFEWRKNSQCEEPRCLASRTLENVLSGGQALTLESVTNAPRPTGRIHLVLRGTQCTTRIMWASP